MGTTVLESGVPIQAGLHVYAHCLRGTPGGVALLVINTDSAAPRTLTLPTSAERYSFTSSDLQSKTVHLNGKKLGLSGNDELPSLKGVSTAAGDIVFDRGSITFLVLPEAANNACR
jgi:heparanase